MFDLVEHAQVPDNWYHSLENFRYIYANPDGYAVADGFKSGGYLIRAVKRTFSNLEISLNQTLGDMIHQIRVVTKETAGRGAVECVQDVSTMTYKVHFRKRMR